MSGVSAVRAACGVAGHHTRHPARRQVRSLPGVGLVCQLHEAPAMMMNRILAVVLLGVIGCATDAEPTFDEFGDDQGDGKSDAPNDGMPRLDVNDVSILYPLPTTASGLTDLLGLDTPTARGPLLSKDQFTALVALIHPEQDTNLRGLQYEDWRVVGVRVDPCEMLAPGMPCTPQLRLVAQSFDHTEQGSSVISDDNAIHLVYSIPEDQQAQMLRDLVALKTSNPTFNTNKKPLGIHPILKSQGLGGTFATDLAQLVTTYAGVASAQNVTVMYTLNAGEWRFAAGTIVNGAVEQVPVPCSPTPTISMSGTTGVVGNFINHVSPAATCADNVNDIIDSSDKGGGFKAGSFYKLADDVQARDVDLALRVLNPNLNRVGTTDCVGCHVASRALARVNDTRFVNLNDGNPNRFVPPKFVTTKYKTSPADAIGPYNVRAFGYQGRDVAYAQVVVNLSALAADAINQKIRTENLLTP
jgi:hypothetical protein